MRPLLVTCLVLWVLLAREALAAFRATCLDDAATVLGAHANQETVGLCALQLLTAVAEGQCLLSHPESPPAADPWMWILRGVSFVKGLFFSTLQGSEPSQTPIKPRQLIIRSAGDQSGSNFAKSSHGDRLADQAFRSYDDHNFRDHARQNLHVERLCSEGEAPYSLQMLLRVEQRAPFRVAAPFHLSRKVFLNACLQMNYGNGR